MKVSRDEFAVPIGCFNDVKTESVDLKIADSKDDLKIETVTFRDKLQPGQKEKWTIKISGADKEKINAEVLANMYDKSLDQFAVNSWNWQKFHSAFYESSYAIGNYLQQQYYRNYFTYRAIITFSHLILIGLMAEYIMVQTWIQMATAFQIH
jgi:hypothetical protein